MTKETLSMKIIDADHFYEELKKNGTKLLQQADPVSFLKNLLDREPAVPPFATGKINGSDIDGAWWNRYVLGDITENREGLKIYIINRSKNCLVPVWAHSEQQAMDIASCMSDMDARAFGTDTGVTTVLVAEKK